MNASPTYAESKRDGLTKDWGADGSLSLIVASLGNGVQWHETQNDMLEAFCLLD